jgi:Immunity protein 50
MGIECHIHIEGAAALLEWYGGMPSFHDSNVLDFSIDGNGSGRMSVQAFSTTDRIDEKGFFILDKHVIVTFLMDGITSVELSGFMQGAILFALDISKDQDGFEMSIESSYGFGGSLKMQKLRMEFRPGKEI